MDPREGKQRQVAQLAGPRMPADHGLSSLGLIMQLGGSVFLGYMAMLAVLPIFAGGDAGSLALFIVGASGAARSAFHRAAGSALLYGSPSGPFRPTCTYIGVSVAQTVLTLLIINKDGGVPAQLNLTLVLLLMAWPITLLVMMSRPRLRSLFRDDGGRLPVAEDLGFEGSAALMVLLGLVGSLVGLFSLYTVFKLPGDALSSPHGLLVLGLFGMLFARSALHTVAGIKGTRGIDSDGATESAGRYYSFGVVSSVIAGGVLFILFMLSPGGGMHPLMLLFVSIAVYLLLSWPLILRRFYTERNFSALLAGAEGPSYRRAPDAGMTAVGWLLLALGALQLAVAIPAAVFGTADVSLALSTLLAGEPGADLAELASGSRSPWWSVGTGMAQVWAGLELVHMTDRHRLAPTIYGVVATLVTLYVLWPQLGQMQHSFVLGGMSGFGSVTVFFQMAINLVVPIGTIALANRALLPTAQARLRVSSSDDAGQ
jgi:hypothetical protein